ncbi:phosphonate metabolism protein/1,5-bisphosphokinase (PRPP-forming) PhnN [Tateyamaria armeniaca]|uniref:ribose 1,5-bisphosphate phosphokinase n=1 Tax=Tateyamaria armeniaca TaxID=2518930 RepID=A0ABW8UP03_9RHOB
MQSMAGADPRLGLVRRVITRPSTAGGEAFDGVDMARFAAMRDAGDFALWWAAHGLHYGIPAGVDADLAAGHDMLANLSRGVLDAAQVRFPSLVIIALTAKPDVLASRLAGRGREDAADIARRLERAGSGIPDSINAVVIDNSGALDTTVDTALSALYPERV